MADIKIENVEKMKVVELRDALKSRGLDTKGVKAVLVKRLKEHLAQEAGGDPGDVSVGSVDTTMEESFNEGESSLKPPAEESTSQAEVAAEQSSAAEVSEVPEASTEQAAEVDDKAEPVEAGSEDEPAQPAEAAAEQEAAEFSPEQQVAEAAAEELAAEAVAEEPAAEAVAEEPTAAEEPMQEAGPTEQEPQETADTGAAEQQEAKPMEEEVKSEQTADKEKPDDAQVESEAGDAQEAPREESRVVDEAKQDDDERKDRDRKRRRSRSPRRRSRSPSPRHSPRRRSPPQQYKPVEMESDDWLQVMHVQLDRYTADIPLVIAEGGCSAEPKTQDGFAFMWHGARSTWGVKQGKVGFEVKLLLNLCVDHLPPEETTRHVLRLGFSAEDTSMQLGEEPLSYGYGGTGKASTDCKFEDYGGTFSAGDVMGAWLDLESEPAVISYTRNGENLGTCFSVEKEKLADKALFPHILTKNISFECNFGQKEEPYFPSPEGFALINSVDEGARVRSTLPPEEKGDCEMLMMCGLPGCGKTTWALKEQKENPDKKYTILGTNSIIDKMKVMGLTRKRNYAGRWNVLIDMSTKCLNKVFDLACRKKRNFILDQTNVYPSAQRRKMRPFEGFKRLAVVIVPSDEAFKQRIEKREKEEGKEVPDSAVYEMKANFQLPEVGALFDEVRYIELAKEDAQKLVEVYNEEGKKHLPPPPKRFYQDRRPQGRFERDRFGGRDQYGGYSRGGGYDRRGGGFDRRGGDRYMGYPDRNRQSGGRQVKQLTGGGSDNRSYGGSGYRQGGNYGGGYGGGQRGYGGGNRYGSGQGGNWSQQQQHRGSWGQQGGGSWGGRASYGQQNQQQWGGYGQQQGYGSQSWSQQQRGGYGGSWSGQGGSHWSSYR